MLDVGTGGQSSSTEWLGQKQQRLCLWVASLISFISASSLQGWPSKPGLLLTGKAAWEGYPAWKFRKVSGNSGLMEEERKGGGG